MNGKTLKELELDKKKLQLSITKAKTAKEEIDMKVLEAEVQVERLYRHQKLQDEVIEKVTLELENLERKIQNFDSEGVENG